jgi:hypothetical protein
VTRATAVASRVVITVALAMTRSDLPSGTALMPCYTAAFPHCALKFPHQFFHCCNWSDSLWKIKSSDQAYLDNFAASMIRGLNLFFLAISGF